MGQQPRARGQRRKQDLADSKLRHCDGRRQQALDGLHRLGAAPRGLRVRSPGHVGAEEHELAPFAARRHDVGVVRCGPATHGRPRPGRAWAAAAAQAQRLVPDLPPLVLQRLRPGEVLTVPPGRGCQAWGVRGRVLPLVLPARPPVDCAPHSGAGCLEVPPRLVEHAELLVGKAKIRIRSDGPLEAARRLRAVAVKGRRDAPEEVVPLRAARIGLQRGPKGFEPGAHLSPGAAHGVLRDALSPQLLRKVLMRCIRWIEAELRWCHRRQTTRCWGGR
mmetsp:Transcript_76787/g.212157  ORF Transcript_76787/g.212157 Transcript_76787/m.212157 type:complete len:276 (+) Transcript_76787:448-1275(+)